MGSIKDWAAGVGPLVGSLRGVWYGSGVKRRL